MRRKSERNKVKGSPEKKVEKPTRKSARRRGKRGTSSSPERDDSQEDTTSDASLSKESSKDAPRLQNKDLRPNPEKSDSIVTSEAVDKDSSPETENNGSVWKVARADASPGEIQKLKLCRQRNFSETSDNSSSRKRSCKWQGSGEGVAEEVDSNDERLGSPRAELSDKYLDDSSSIPPGQDSNQEVSDYKETLPETTSANLSDNKPNIDMQGDSNEESFFIPSNDTKPDSVDTSTDHISYGDNTVLTVSRQQEIMMEQIEGIYNQESQQQNVQDPELTVQKEENFETRHEVFERVELSEVHSEQDGISQQENVHEKVENVLVIEKQVPKEEETLEIQNQASQENVTETDEQTFPEVSEIKEQVSSESIPNINEQAPTREELPQSTENCQEENSLQMKQEKEEKVAQGEEDEIVKKDENASQGCPESLQKFEHTSDKDDFKDSSSEDEQEKIHSDSNSIDETQVEIMPNVRASSRSNRRKHRNKYHDSSNSDTPESEDEPSLEREPKQPETPEEEEEEKVIREKDYHRDRNCSKSPEPIENSPLLKSGQRVNQVEVEKEVDKDSTSGKNLSTTVSDASAYSQKPAKINLKRTFTRVSVDDKSENSSLSANIASTQTKENHSNNSAEQKRVPKKRRWGTTLSTDSVIEFSISTDSLKALVPGAKPLSITEVRLSKDDEDEYILRDKGRTKYMKNDDSDEYTVKEDVVSKSEDPRKGDTKTDNQIGSRRKISVVKDIPQTMSPSPPSMKATNILLIKNLVRPFTLTQIKELLSRTGTIMENGFWMDRIKSKCFVEYSNEDQAFETRQALHGISWPTSNPKKLQVEYALKEDMELAREMSKDQLNSRKTESIVQSDSWQRGWAREEKNQIGGTKQVIVVREWDLGKEDGQHVMKEEREKRDLEKKKRQRTQSPMTEVHLPAPARKFKKKEDEPPPAKLLDDLFRKTKATPCIYWLPLTNDQIVVNEEMRRQRMAEHARRFEEMRRAERNRDTRRRRSPRK